MEKGTINNDMYVGGNIAHWLVFLLSDPVVPDLILSDPKIFSEEKIVDCCGTKTIVNTWDFVSIN